MSEHWMLDLDQRDCRQSLRILGDCVANHFVVIHRMSEIRPAIEA